MPNVVLPTTLTDLFPDAPRRVSVEGATVLEVLDRLDEKFPGMRSRICEPQAGGARIRRHLLIFVDDERSDLTGAVGASSEVRVVPALSGG
ncbi:MAG: MoaD/ThiS family protein [Chloroflexota bacterium]